MDTVGTLGRDLIAAWVMATSGHVDGLPSEHCRSSPSTKYGLLTCWDPRGLGEVCIAVPQPPKIDSFVERPLPTAEEDAASSPSSTGSSGPRNCLSRRERVPQEASSSTVDYHCTVARLCATHHPTSKFRSRKYHHKHYTHTHMVGRSLCSCRCW